MLDSLDFSRSLSYEYNISFEYVDIPLPSKYIRFLISHSDWISKNVSTCC